MTQKRYACSQIRNENPVIHFHNIFRKRQNITYPALIGLRPYLTGLRDLSPLMGLRRPDGV